jgi:amino acid transporter
VFGLIAFVLVFAGAGLVNGDVGHLKPYFGKGPSEFLALLLTTPLFFAGFGAVPQALGESSPEALKKAPAIITIVILAAIGFHIVVIMPSALVLTPQEAATSSLPVALAFQRAFHSDAMAAGALVAALIALITTWNAVLFSASRILYALGHGRLGPRFLGQRHRRFGTPVMSILVVTACTFIAIPLGKGMLGPVISIGGLSVTLVFLMISVCVLRSRLTSASGGRRSLLLPLVSIVIAASLLGLNLFDIASKFISGGPTELIILGAWAVLGTLVWLGSEKGRRSLALDERDALILGPEQVKLI